jgi:hypothetical protein
MKQLYQIGKTKFFIHPNESGWTVVYEVLPEDPQARYFEYWFCWHFYELEILLKELPQLVRLKVKTKREKIKAEPRAIDAWIKLYGLQALVQIQTEKMALQKLIDPLQGKVLPEGTCSVPILHTPYFLKSLGKLGWEVYSVLPSGKPKPVWHAFELTHLLKKIPLLFYEVESRRYGGDEGLMKSYEANWMKTRKWILRTLTPQLTGSLQLSIASIRNTRVEHLNS